MKLRIQARAIGIKTSLARCKIATTITEIKMVLSVDDDEFTALSSISTTNYHNLIANKPARTPRRARPRTGTSQIGSCWSLGAASPREFLRHQNQGTPAHASSGAMI